eukprot:251482_1
MLKMLLPRRCASLSVVFHSKFQCSSHFAHRFVSNGHPQTMASSQVDVALDGGALRRRLVHRSKQRGLKELDLILGNWADQNVSKLNENELEEYARILRHESPDILAWLLGQQKAPVDLHGSVMSNIEKFVRNGNVCGI